MNSKMTTTLQTSTSEPKKQNYANWNGKRITEMEITWRVISGEGVEDMGEKVQGIRNRNCRYKIDRGRLRIVWEMEKPKNLYV